MAVTPQGQAGEARLYEYWAGKGRAGWADSAKPYTTLQRLLLKEMLKSGTDPARAEHMSKGMAARLHKMVFGDAPGSDTARVRHGKPPRGDRIGPG